MFFALIFIFSPIISVSAKTSQEIEVEKQQKQEELDKLNSELEEAEASLSTSESRKSSSLSEIEKIENELTIIEDQIKVNELKQKKLKEEISIKKLEKEKREEDQNIQVQHNYIDWKTQDSTSMILQGDDLLKSTVYYNYVTDQTTNSILGIARELKTLNKENELSESELATLALSNEELKAKQEVIQKQIEEINNAIANARTNADGIRSRAQGVQQQIEQLSAEQQAIQQKDNQITGGNPGGGSGGGTVPVESGEIYFSGTGRDLYQGHGVGMSQFGAFGAALSGWSADQIVTFYYSQTSVQNRAGTVHVVGNTSNDGYVDRVMDLNEYVAGLGEVPDKACGTTEQAIANPSKYIVGTASGSNWSCWPEEAIKAQMIAARSYAASNGGSICTTTVCQVYKGGTAKQWAADETNNKVIVSNGYTHNGQIIRALYSSDNNQGNGTANNDTVWSNFSGDGTAYSYLRHVNDNHIAYHYSYTSWQWRTNSYTIEEINDLFVYAQSNYSSASSFITGIKSQVGTVTNLDFEKDPSGRVKKVIVIGTNGSANMAGWLFKAMWNDWVNNQMPSGETDYIYSLTWTKLQG